MPSSYTYQWINRLDQFDSVSIDLVVTDDDGIIPTQRIGKNYAFPSEYVDEVFLAEEAANEVDRIVTEWIAGQEPVIE